MSFCLIRHFLKRVLNYCVTFSNESLHLIVLPRPLRETNPIPCTFFQVLEGNLNLVVELIGLADGIINELIRKKVVTSL